MTADTSAGRSGVATCPHCGGKLKIRSSRVATELSRDLLLVCASETGCSAKFAAQIEILHQTAPSARPREGLKLRQAPPRRRTANDDHLPRQGTRGPEVPLPANENDVTDAATG